MPSQETAQNVAAFGEGKGDPHDYAGRRARATPLYHCIFYVPGAALMFQGLGSSTPLHPRSEPF